MPPTGRRAIPARRVPIPVVLAAVVLALATVAASTTLLLRPARSVEAWVHDRDVRTVQPRPPTEDPTGLHLLLVPHPDDELSGWTSLLDADQLRPVLVVLTRGDATRRCGATVFERTLRENLGEVRPVPDPTSSVEACGDARVGSLHAALAEAALHTPVVDLGGAPGRTLDVGGHRVEVLAGEHATLVLADLGDGQLEAEAVEQLALELLQDPVVAPPGLAVARITASAYYASEGAPSARDGCSTPSLCPEGERPYVYEHPDHLAVREAARALAPSSGQGSWLVTHPWDPAATVHLALPGDVYDAELGLAEGRPREARRTGSYQRIYGWLAFPDAWRPGDLPLRADEVFLPRIQSYEVVRP